MATLLIMSGQQAGTEFHLKPGVNRIGRNPGNDCQLSDPSVSNYHCEVTRSETAVSVRDLGSTNGTYVDGRPVSEEAAERLEQVLQVGGVTLQLEIDLSGEDAPIVRIPQLPVEEPIRSGELPDGSPACANHPAVAASYRCSHCDQTLCEECVRVVHRHGGMTLVFCSLCSAACEAVPLEGRDRRRTTLLSWLADALKQLPRR